jgi:hypothetical protein
MPTIDGPFDGMTHEEAIAKILRTCECGCTVARIADDPDPHLAGLWWEFGEQGQRGGYCRECGSRLNPDGTTEPRVEPSLLDTALRALDLACMELTNRTGECPMNDSDDPLPAEGRFSWDDCEATCSERTGESGTDFTDCWADWFLLQAREAPDASA